MKFVVNDIAATPDAGGVYSILEDFYNEVVKNDRKNKWIFLLSGKYFKESNNVKIIVRADLKKSKVKKAIFELLTGKIFVNKLKPDVYISLQNTITIGVKANKEIVYLHQPIPFQNEKIFSLFKKNERSLFFYQRIVGGLIKYSLNRENPSVIVQTKWMEKAIREQTKVSHKNIYVAHPRVKINTGKQMRHDLNSSFFYPASNYIYKNHKIIFSAIDLLRRDGITDFTVNFTLRKEQLPYSNNNINYLGHIKRKEVFRLYNTNCLIFPSYIESFGLPLIEAALTGDVILASNTEFSRELLKNYSNVYFFNAFDAKELANLMKKVINREIVSNGRKLSLVDNGESLLTSVFNILEENYE